jgi:general secretion pathway protein A
MRVDIRYHLNPYDRQKTGEYIRKHLEYAGETRDIFTEKAIGEIYEYSYWVARKISKVCTAFLMHAA